MRRVRGRRLQLALVSLLMSLSQAQTTLAAPRPGRTTASSIVLEARSFVKVKDYLGFRIWIRKLYTLSVSRRDWYELRNLVNTHAEDSGFDLIPLWNSRNSRGKSAVDLNLDRADQLLLSERFDEAFELYQAQAQYLKKLKTAYEKRGTPGATRQMDDIDVLYPFVLQAMGRALFGAGRFQESVDVYDWIEPSYPRFRQVLFEKMWAAFRAGRVDIALGAIASQRSAFFSRYLPPEAYLIQVYAYKKLCRDDDLKLVIGEMRKFGAALEADETGNEWFSGDVETLVLSQLARSKTKPEFNVRLIPETERVLERSAISQALTSAYQRKKPVLLYGLKNATAFAHLANVTDTSTALKPVRVMKDRKELLRQDLEVWPADSSEDWIDEVGHHVLMGDSLCKR